MRPLPPRSGEPLRRLLRAQLGRWWLHSPLGFAAVIAIGGGAFAWAVDDEFKRGVETVALGVLPIDRPRARATYPAREHDSRAARTTSSEAGSSETRRTHDDTIVNVIRR